MTSRRSELADAGDLTQRVRGALGSGASVREVTMFGGRAFMLHEKIVLSAGRSGDLLVRVDPDRSDELLAIRGARQATMGAGRSMGRGWITVDKDATATEEGLAFWIGVAVDYREKSTD